jgi:hypothetical protein
MRVSYFGGAKIGDGRWAVRDGHPPGPINDAIGENLAIRWLFELQLFDFREDRRVLNP